MTYSIVARDAESGRFVAIQTCWPFVGADCAWVESGVGAVASETSTSPARTCRSGAGMEEVGAASAERR